ncbi:ABC transporter ATP-binding protein [Pseudomonas abietaniphila]|uniref:Lipopolysaccharide transport system ATP-binding protein n=1 Tax=Pseudomonas abietaniphila TaxID=89065 RepID=A0A1G8BST1_9PSED|nr:ABC transporter ATP-binding protein [Pseudomonas abietaniphila]SDH36159.1 lipopolysaccharide transport system ATP-binding protein [Pseudomonas abietaniphila]
MSSEIVISIDNVSKRYELFRSPMQRVKGLLFSTGKKQEFFQALQPLSVNIKRGRFFGIIGQNGSGKSTLLQIICGIIRPTTGNVKVKGRIAALLELGAGFNPEFTGRENARLNAQILGISGKQFDKVFPEIEEFADIGQFMDNPVKSYSSGMFVRLAFAVQACIDPDVLIVDEALAVGDIFFRLKCYERLERLRDKGCTVILVTHSMDDVMHYCDEVLLLNRGVPVFVGEATEAINRYYALGHVNARKMINEDAARLNSAAANMVDEDNVASNDNNAIIWPVDIEIDTSSREQTGDGLIRCTRIALTDREGAYRQVFHQFDVLRLYAEFVCEADLETPVAGFVIRTDRGVVIHGRNSGQCGADVPRRISKGQVIRSVFEIPLDFSAGEYLLDIGFATWPTTLQDKISSSTMAEIESASARHCVLTGVASFSIVPVGHLGFAAQPFYGVASVNSSAKVSIAS